MTQWKIKFEDLEMGLRIGKGNFGEVYKGTYLGTDVAIKRLFFVDDDFMQKYIEREMDTLTQLNHPNIVQLIGLCIGLDDLFIVTEFVSGGNLHSKLENKAIELDWKLRASLLRDFALAMTFLHAKGIIHRDLKSHNLLVTDEWRLKVCDFGLARPAPQGEEKQAGLTIVGTNEWMAPEVAAGDVYDSSCDVFSYGMVIWELLTREEPPVRKPRDAYAFMPNEMKPRLPSDAPTSLWELLIECAATDAKGRPDFKTITNRIKEIYDQMPGTGKIPSTTGTSASAEPPPPTKAKTTKKESDGKKKTPKKEAEGKKKSSKKGGDAKKKKKKKKTGDDTGAKKKKTKKRTKET